MSLPSLISLLFLTPAAEAVGTASQTQITIEEVREAIDGKRRGRMSIAPAPTMPLAVGQAVCGRIGLGRRGMPERFVYLRYSHPHHATRIYFERDADAREREQLDRLWKQLGCTGL